METQPLNSIKVAFFDAKPYDIKSFDETNKDFGVGLTYFTSHLTRETASLAQGHDAVCAFVNDVLDKETLEILYQQKVRLIALRAAGYNNVDFKFAFQKIHIARVPAYSPYAVAEHAVALILTLNRKPHRAYLRTHDNNFSLDGLMGFDMHGKTAGIIGTGQIGKVLIGILKGFGMRILAYDAFPDKAYQEKAGIEYTDLDTLYRESDILSLHCPLNEETYHLIGQEAIAKMKPGIMIINTGRGALLDSKALIEGLKTRRIGFAGLDVYEEESDYFFEDRSSSVVTDDLLARLLSFNNVVVTSHQGFFTREAMKNIAQTTLISIKEFFTEQKLTHEICYQCSTTSCPRKTTGQCF